MFYFYGHKRPEWALFVFCKLWALGIHPGVHVLQVENRCFTLFNRLIRRSVFLFVTLLTVAHQLWTKYWPYFYVNQHVLEYGICSNYEIVIHTFPTWRISRSTTVEIGFKSNVTLDNNFNLSYSTYPFNVRWKKFETHF